MENLFFVYVFFHIPVAYYRRDFLQKYRVEYRFCNKKKTPNITNYHFIVFIEPLSCRPSSGQIRQEIVIRLILRIFINTTVHRLLWHFTFSTNDANY